jgi:exodeoxyribonuclease V alpha subunit
MVFEEAKRKLKLFEIPGDGGESSEHVRNILARLMALRAVSLGEMQTARDIVTRKENVPSAAYVFLAAMFVSLHDGNTVLNLGNKVNGYGKLLVDACRRNAKTEDEPVINVLEESVRSIWSKAVEAAEVLKGDVIDKIGETGNEKIILWFFDRQREAVGRVSKFIKDKLGATGETLTDDELNSVIGYKGRDGKSFTLGEEQKHAVRATVEHNLTVITGGPGTGKTTIVCSILRALLRKMGLKSADVALTAPTGRAAQRMGEALRAQCRMATCVSKEDKALCESIEKLEGTTVHSLLGGYGPRWTHNEENPLPHRLVIVDECSMVDLILMRSLLLALRKDCRLVLLGDKNQLPSVEAGAVLGDLMEIADDEKNKDAFAELTESRRFKGRLGKCAAQFSQGESTAVMEAKLPGADGGKWTDALREEGAENCCFWYELSGDCRPAKIDVLLKEWASVYGLAKDGMLVNAARAVRNDEKVFAGECSDSAMALFKALDASRILAVVKNGPFGVHHINELLFGERFGRNPMESLVDDGIPVVITKNTRALNLFNGDVGVTVKRPGRGVYVLFPRGEKIISCPVSLLPEYELAYAMTVHKSQGSEFENVMMVLPDDERHPLLNRQIVYTGITRAKKRAVIVGTDGALTTALQRKLERDTGIALGDADCA